MRAAIHPILAVIGVAIAVAVGAGCAARALPSSSARDTPHLRSPTSSAAGLSPLELAGERVVYAYSGLTPPAALLTAVSAGEAAGVILFTPNIGARPQLRAVITLLQHAALKSPVHRRLLILTDQEGGEVRRLSGAPTLSEKHIGASARGRTLAGQAGSDAAANLRGVGINVNLAPVLDVFRAPGDFIDEFQRSYSSNPRTVAQLGAAFVSAQQAGGVAATAKHFPGLGEATSSQDTDTGPVTLRQPLSTIRGVDEAPYRSVITAGVKLVMSSWAIYPALDPGRPAGLSVPVVQGELRGRLGFGGVTITDSIDAGAIQRYGSVGHRAVLAALAGQDLILASTTSAAGNSPAYGFAALHAIASAISSGAIDRGAAQASASRVLALRSRP